MEEKDFPYPLGVKEIVVLTEEEKAELTAALDAGWKEFCSARHDILGLRAKRIAQPPYDWDRLPSGERHARLLAGGVDVPVEWVEEGWPYHGIISKLTKFAGPLTRMGYAVRTAGFSEERQQELLEHLHVVEDVDKAYLSAARDVHNQIQHIMSNTPHPKGKAELVAAIDAPMDKDYYVGKYMEATVNRPSPEWSEFAAKFEVHTPLPVVEKPVEEPTAPKLP